MFLLLHYHEVHHIHHIKENVNPDKPYNLKAGPFDITKGNLSITKGNAESRGI